MSDPNGLEIERLGALAVRLVRYPGFRHSSNLLSERFALYTVLSVSPNTMIYARALTAGRSCPTPQQRMLNFLQSMQPSSSSKAHFFLRQRQEKQPSQSLSLGVAAGVTGECGVCLGQGECSLFKIEVPTRPIAHAIETPRLNQILLFVGGFRGM